MSRKILILLLVFVLIVLLIGMNLRDAGETDAEASKIPIKVLILPKFELDGLEGDFPGEGQFYFERYLRGADSYEIPGGDEGTLLYVKDGIGFYLLGIGKTKAALNTMAVLSDPRFDFSDAWLFSTGCAGSAVGSTVMGDVFLITAAADYDLGHQADTRDMSEKTDVTWFQNPDVQSGYVYTLDPELMEKTYSLVKDLTVKTTERTRNYMSAAFDGAEWAVRDPRVLRGTAVTGDNYWKGPYDHANALKIVETYDCPDPFVVTEMEEIGVCAAAERMGMLDRLIILRDSVNMDVFMLGATPERLWSDTTEEMALADENSVEAADIFPVSMENNFIVGSVIIDAIMDGSF